MKINSISRHSFPTIALLDKSTLSKMNIDKVNIKAKLQITSEKTQKVELMLKPVEKKNI